MEHTTTPPTRPNPPALVAGALAVAVLGLVGFHATSGAIDGDPAAAAAVGGAGGAGGAELVTECEIGPEDVAALQAEEDALAAFLDRRGIAYQRQTGEDGVRFVIWDETDEAANQAVEEFYVEQEDAHPPSPEDAEMLAEITAAMNAQEEELAAYLDERGIAYRWGTDASGMRYVVVDEEDEAANQAIDDFYVEQGVGHTCPSAMSESG